MSKLLGPEHADIHYHIKRHTFKRFKEIVDILVETYGVEILNTIQEYRLSALSSCLNKTPPDIERFQYLVHKGAAVDINHPSYRDVYDKPLKNIDKWSLAERWSISAQDNEMSSVLLKLILEAGEKPDNHIQASYLPLFYAKNETQFRLLFDHGASLTDLKGHVEENPTLLGNLLRAEEAYRRYVAHSAAQIAEDLLVTEEPKKRMPKL